MGFDRVGGDNVFLLSTAGVLLIHVFFSHGLYQAEMLLALT